MTERPAAPAPGAPSSRTPSVITSGRLSAVIDPLGAQLVRLRDHAGRDLLWHGDAAWWSGRAPVLFPIVGELAGGRYRLEGREWALPRHGFARGRVFDVVASSATAVTLRLRDDDATRAAWPFAFLLELHYAIDGARLDCIATVHNRDSRPMPASIGFHPGFAWPLPYGGAREAHVVEFDVDEPADVRRLTSAGLLSPAAVPTPVVDRRVALRDDLFAPDVVIWDDLRSRRVRYGIPGGPGIELSFPDAAQLGLWTRPGAPFVCIEPWQGHADPAGWTGTFDAKPATFVLGPGDTRRHAMSIAVDAP